VGGPADAASEKIAMGWHLDGRVSVVFGTHTHVPTGDARVLPGGTAYMTDLGMTGPYDSVLGRCKHRVLLRGALISVEAGTGRARSIEAIEFMATADG
jgi:calcineurin-like phosphoesterase